MKPQTRLRRVPLAILAAALVLPVAHAAQPGTVVWGAGVMIKF